MLVCTQCKKEKSFSEFSERPRQKSGYRSACKECTNMMNRKSYQNTKYRTMEDRKKRCSNYVKKIREEVNLLKHNLGCFLCHENDPVCLDFHHKNPKDKTHSISWMMSAHKSIEKIKIEIEKCVVVCSNCHRKIHAGSLIGDIYE